MQSIVQNRIVSKSVLFETIRFTNYIITKGFCNVQFFSDFFILQGLFETFRTENDILGNVLLQSHKVHFLRLFDFAQLIA